MIRYSSYGGTNYREKPSERSNWTDPLEKEFRELQQLRERVKQAKIAAKCFRSPGRPLTKQGIGEFR